jgi:hypothetical protein
VFTSLCFEVASERGVLLKTAERVKGQQKLSSSL